MKDELNLSQSTTYLNVLDMWRGQYKMCPNSGDLSLKVGKKKLYGRRINYKPQESYQTPKMFLTHYFLGGKSHCSLDKS